QLVERELERLVELGLNRVAPLRRGVILRDLASILGVEEAAVLAQARRYESRRVRRRAAVDAAETTENRLDDADSAQEMRDSPEAQILGCILVDPALFRGKSLDPGLFVNAAHRKLAIRLAGTQTDEIDHLLTRLEDPGVRTAAVHAYARVKRITEQDRGRLQTTFDECLATLTTRQNRSARDGDAVTVLERLTLAKETSTDPIALARTTH
ncbi:MAG: hypothetical protein KAS72_13850, partial [Phycisphaerales bacterium]|nr:hypothetical protein [Phycisphaerales bacterium]